MIRVSVEDAPAELPAVSWQPSLYEPMCAASVAVQRVLFAVAEPERSIAPEPADPKQAKLF